MTEAPISLVLLGCGYSAAALVRRAQGKGWRIAGTTTRADKLERMRAAGIEPIVFDGGTRSAELAHRLAEATHVVVSAPPGEAGDPVLAQHGGDIVSAQRLAWIGYLSTVGVYGDRQGGWVDEDADLRPSSQRSRRRAQAEQAWLDLGRCAGKRVQVLRLSGIYGPGRSAIDNLRAGTARRIVKRDQVFNRIHVEDIAAALEAGIAGRGTHSIYNVTDDEPAPPQDVIAHGARLIGVAVPPDVPFEQAELSAMGASFYAENKRVSNARMKRDLGVALAYPTYREGLAAIAQAG